MNSNLLHHYHEVSDAWSLIMGDCQHFSMNQNLENFDSIEKVQNKLSQGAYLTIENLLSLLPPNNTINKSSSILDLGCGRGGASFYLHEKYQCEISAVALSETELLVAKKKAEEKSLNNLHFSCSDAQNCAFKNEQFSHIIMLESSLLVPNKADMFEEIKRMLKKGGNVLFCDPIKLKTLSAKEMYRLGEVFESVEKCFGKSSSLFLEEYKTLLSKAGFSSIETHDVSHEFLHAPNNWKHSALLQKEEIIQSCNNFDLQEFIEGCDALTQLLLSGVLGYGFIKAERH